MDPCEPIQKSEQNVTVDLDQKDTLAKISLAYAIPTFCLSFRIIMVLVNKKNKDLFSGSFYTIFILACILVRFYSSA
jgi:positive regulator of sigma E activity